MGQVVSEVLAPALAGDASVGEARPLLWAGKDMGRPTIDLEDKDALWQVLDREQLEKDTP